MLKLAARAGHGLGVLGITSLVRLVSRASSRSLHFETEVSLVPAWCQMRQKSCKGEGVEEEGERMAGSPLSRRARTRCFNLRENSSSFLFFFLNCLQIE